MANMYTIYIECKTLMNSQKHMYIGKNFGKAFHDILNMVQGLM